MQNPSRASNQIVGRPRKHRSTLPAYVRARHGSFLFHDKKLCRVEEGESRMYEVLAERKRGLLDITMVPAAVAAFKLDYLKTLSPSAKKEHDRLLTVFANDFTEYRVDQITAVDVRRSIRNLYAGRAAAAKHYKSRISRFFRWAVEEAGLRAANPCREVWVEKPIPRRTPWTDALFWAVRDKLGAMQQCYHDLSFLLYQRTTDMRYLRRAQASGGVIHFEPSKTISSSGAAVDVPITPAIQTVLDRAAALSKLYKVVCPYIIHTRQGAPFTRSGIHSAYRRADEELHGKAGLLHLNPKALLPFAVTSAKKQGYDMEQLRVGRAHASIKTTEGYIHTHEIPVSQVMLTLPERKP